MFVTPIVTPITFYRAALHQAAGQCACFIARIAARLSCLYGAAVHPACHSGFFVSLISSELRMKDCKS